MGHGSYFDPCMYAHSNLVDHLACTVAHDGGAPNASVPVHAKFKEAMCVGGLAHGAVNVLELAREHHAPKRFDL